MKKIIICLKKRILVIFCCLATGGAMVFKLKSFTFKYKLSLLLFTLVVLTTGFLGLCQYLFMQNALANQFEQKKELVKARILNLVTNADTTSRYIEAQMEKDARVILNKIKEEYEKNDSINFSLASFLTSVHNTNIYIIDRSSTVVSSTDRSEVGLDFKGYTEFLAFLEATRINGEFSAPRVSLSIIGSQMTKYCYLPSDDGKYIFETGMTIEDEYGLLSGTSFSDFESRIIEENAFINRIMMYDYNGVAYKKDAAGGQLRIDDASRSYFQKALDHRTEVEVAGLYDNMPVTYTYLPYQIIGAEGVNETNAIEIIFNDNELRESRSWNIRITLLIALSVGFLSASLGVFLAGSISKPIQKIAQAVRHFSEGDFDYAIDVDSNDEFSLLSRQFESMGRDIKHLLNKRFEYEQALEEKSRAIFDQKEEITVLYEETTAMNEELENLLHENKNNYFETVRALVNAVDAKDTYTGGHCERVTEYSLLIADAMELSSQEKHELRFGGMLHDIGKIGIPEHILNKLGRFTDDEYAFMKRHPEIGESILKDAHFLVRSRRIVLEHHEHYDGRGYPHGLKGEEIDILSRIVCVADAYDAMTSSRPYRQKAFTMEQAIEELLKNRGTQFDPTVVDAFVDCLQSKAQS